MNLWPVEHFFPPFFSRSALNQHWSGKKQGKKGFNWSEVHFVGSTSYEIHILAGRMLHAKYEGESLLPWYSRANLPEKFYFVIPNARTM